MGQNDGQTDRMNIPGRKYILTCLVQGEKNDSPIELGSDLGQRHARMCRLQNHFGALTPNFHVKNNVAGLTLIIFSIMEKNI